MTIGVEIARANPGVVELEPAFLYFIFDELTLYGVAQGSRAALLLDQ